MAEGLISIFAALGVRADGQAHAAIYVVDQAAPGAADTNAGTEKKPFKTVQRAAEVVKPGDTVFVLAGTYDEKVKLITSGAEGQPITLDLQALAEQVYENGRYDDLGYGAELDPPLAGEDAAWADALPRAAGRR